MRQDKIRPHDDDRRHQRCAKEYAATGGRATSAEDALYGNNTLIAKLLRTVVTAGFSNSGLSSSVKRMGGSDSPFHARIDSPLAATVYAT